MAPGRSRQEVRDVVAGVLSPLTVAACGSSEDGGSTEQVEEDEPDEDEPDEG
ncbi:hypothetical protein [Geodermatophilus amargosae]|uniref:hypothetical protein n=1 Tax=Geodermatophilus amargosae TaxID=1296565 RepID=UPI0034DE28E5